MTRELRRFAVVTGIICLLLGLVELALGSAAVPGAGPSDASGDSSDRFAGAIIAGFGLAWLWAARTEPVPVPILRALAGILLLGAVGRVISLLDQGRPHWFTLAQLGVEAIVPIIVLALAGRTTGHPAGRKAVQEAR